MEKDIKVDVYLMLAIPPAGFSMLIVLGLVAMFATGPDPIFSLFVMGGLVCLLSIHKRAYVDTASRKYMEYVWFVGMKFGRLKSYGKVEHLFMSRKNQTMGVGINPRLGQITSIKSEIFLGKLRFDNRDKIEVCSGDKEKVLKAMKEYSLALNAKLFDVTGKKPVEIEFWD